MRSWQGLVALLAIACGSTREPPVVSFDAGGEEAPVGHTDTDGDGVCDDTEGVVGSNPEVADSDADAYPDRVEILLGLRPTQPASPDRDSLVMLFERPEATALYEIVVPVSGSGGDYQGAAEAGSSTDSTGLTADDFFLGARATFAVPSGAAAEVDEEGQTFYSVTGDADLRFEVEFAFGDNEPADCTRAFMFDYGVKRSDGRFVDISHLLLVTLPPGDSVAMGQWCEPIGDCF